MSESNGLTWIYEDDGKTLATTVPGITGVVFKVRPATNGEGSIAEAYVGNTSHWGEPDVTLVASWQSGAAPGSQAAKANAVKAFKDWADSVVTLAS